MTLFDHMMNGIFPPATRRDDPVTSRLAEQRVNLGSRANHCRIVLAAVRKYPSMTAVELLPFTGLERHEVSRRLADLRSRGDVRVVGRRKCRVNGTAMLTWEVT